jgi:alkanesulfonate monooxygenase SsuD/methylene tetrahydromethanopterin reductase-like flavin-dependent oxidoreductase (luciferase family)
MPHTIPALEVYRRHFTPSPTLHEPHAMVGVAVRAETDEGPAVAHLRTPLVPETEPATLHAAPERPGRTILQDERVRRRLTESHVGSPETVRAGLTELQRAPGRTS